jgi:hypothetical protein
LIYNGFINLQMFNQRSRRTAVRHRQLTGFYRRPARQCGHRGQNITNVENFLSLPGFWQHRLDDIIIIFKWQPRPSCAYHHARTTVRAYDAIFYICGGAHRAPG